MENWYYYVRIFADYEPNLLIEISAHPKSIEDDLKNIFAYMRNETEFRIVDECGEDETSDW